MIRRITKSWRESSQLMTPDDQVGSRFPHEAKVRGPFGAVRIHLGHVGKILQLQESLWGVGLSIHNGAPFNGNFVGLHPNGHNDSRLPRRQNILVLEVRQGPTFWKIVPCVCGWACRGIHVFCVLKGAG